MLTVPASVPSNSTKMHENGEGRELNTQLKEPL
jgi:hypothetical protein